MMGYKSKKALFALAIDLPAYNEQLLKFKPTAIKNGLPNHVQVKDSDGY
jgi:hypothetical protein